MDGFYAPRRSRRGYPCSASYKQFLAAGGYRPLTRRHDTKARKREYSLFSPIPATDQSVVVLFSRGLFQVGGCREAENACLSRMHGPQPSQPPSSPTGPHLELILPESLGERIFSEFSSSESQFYGKIDGRYSTYPSF